MGGIRHRASHQSYEGFETWLNALKMTVKMHTRVVSLVIIAGHVLFLLLAWGTYSFKTELATRYVFARMFHRAAPHLKIPVHLPDKTALRMSAAQLYGLDTVRLAAVDEFERLKAGYFKTNAAALVLYPFLIVFFRRRSRHQSGKRYIRGAVLDTAEAFTRAAKRAKVPLDLPFGEIRMPIAAETKHLFLVGRPGTGKTTALSAVLERLYARGEKAVIYDNKGDYLAKFYDPERDLIFNPLDQRSVGWNLFNELSTYMDVEAVSSSLIPAADGKLQFFNDAARAVFTGILHYLYAKGEGTNARIWELVTEDGESIKEKLKATSGGKAGAKFVEMPGSNQGLGVFATVMQYAKCFEYMEKTGGEFSISRWLKGQGGRIYVTNYQDVKETLKPILSLFIDLLGRKLLSLPDDDSRRVFFLLDEFGTLQRLPTIVQLLTLSRSKGGCCFLGIQDYGQIDRIYSREERQSIVNACGNAAVMAVSEEAARIASSAIGETEFLESERSFSMGVKNWRDGTSLSERRKREPLFLPSDISNLPELTGIVKFVNFNYVTSRWVYRGYRDRNVPFLLREDLNLERIAAEQKRIDQARESLVAELEIEDLLSPEKEGPL